MTLAAVLVFVLVLAGGTPPTAVEAARGNTISNHVFANQATTEHAAESMLPALQEVASLLDEAAVTWDAPPATPAPAAAADAGGLQEQPEQQDEQTNPPPPPALQEVIDTLESARRLLAITPGDEEGQEAASDTAAAVPAPSQAAVQEVVSMLEASTRRLLQQTTNVTHLREEAKAVLLASDAFGVAYTAGNFVRAIFALLTPMVVAGQTGVIAVDANYLLNISQLLAQLTATTGDLLSKSARLSADGIAPI